MLPDGFVYLNEFDSDLIIHSIYYSTSNFTGERVDGYNHNRLCLTREAAGALSNVSKDVMKDGYRVVVYDAYRSQTSVNHFVSWSCGIDSTTDTFIKDLFYPYVDRSKAFDLGYIACKSSHSRGSTIDLTLIKASDATSFTYSKTEVVTRQLTDGRTIRYVDDKTLDMYTSIDLFDQASWHDTDLIPFEYIKNRNYLREKMKIHNFREYNQEWWHYTLDDEPNRTVYYDFIC